MSRDVYGQCFRQARYDAARRLDPRLEDRAEAAKAMGLTDAFLRKLESGEKRPGFETLETMARVYNVLVGDLFPASAPKGAEVDRVLGSLMALPPTPRTMLMAQFEGMARALAASIADVQLRAETREYVTQITANSEMSGDKPLRPQSQTLGGSIGMSTRASQKTAVSDVPAPQKEVGEDG